MPAPSVREEQPIRLFRVLVIKYTIAHLSQAIPIEILMFKEIYALPLDLSHPTRSSCL